MDPREIPLRDLHLPEAIGWWPAAPGWWLVVAFAVAGLAWLVSRFAQRRALAAARRQALGELDAIGSTWSTQHDAVAAGRDLSTLLRRAMLAYAPRAEVAGLAGEAWLRWLDRDLPEPVFAEGPGRCLLELPYRDPASVVREFDVDGLIAAVRVRLQTPIGGTS